MNWRFRHVFSEKSMQLRGPGEIKTPQRGPTGDQLTTGVGLQLCRDSGVSLLTRWHHSLLNNHSGLLPLNSRWDQNPKPNIPRLVPTETKETSKPPFSPDLILFVALMLEPSMFARLLEFLILSRAEEFQFQPPPNQRLRVGRWGLARVEVFWGFAFSHRRDAGY